MKHHWTAISMRVLKLKTHFTSKIPPLFRSSFRSFTLLNRRAVHVITIKEWTKDPHIFNLLRKSSEKKGSRKKRLTQLHRPSITRWKKKRFLELVFRSSHSHWSIIFILVFMLLDFFFFNRTEQWTKKYNFRSLYIPFSVTLYNPIHRSSFF